MSWFLPTLEAVIPWFWSMKSDTQLCRECTALLDRDTEVISDLPVLAWKYIKNYKTSC